MPKRASVNVAMPLEFTLFTPTYRAGFVLEFRGQPLTLVAGKAAG